MDVEAEFYLWLCRKEKTSIENIKFAINSWNSVEFALASKYEIITKWFCEMFESNDLQNSTFDWDLVNEFLSLKCPTGIISFSTNTKLVKALIRVAKILDYDKDKSKVNCLRTLCQKLSLRNFYKNENKQFCKVYKSLFNSFLCYIRKSKVISLTEEKEYFTNVITDFKEIILCEIENKKFFENFQKYCLTSLVELLIIFKTKGLNFISDLTKIEENLFFQNKRFLIEVFFIMSPHVYVQSLECAIEYFRNISDFRNKLISFIFETMPRSNKLKEKELILVSGHVFNLMRKYDVQITFDTTNRNIVQYLNEKIETYVDKYHKNHLAEIFSLLCSTIRYNPLIIERSFFSITMKCIMSRKSDRDWRDYEEFLILMIDMFRKLNRLEKMVPNLLKYIKEYLKEFKLSKKLKRKIPCDETTCEKKDKFEVVANGDMDDESDIKDEEDSMFDKFYLDTLLNEFSQQNLAHPPSSADKINDRWSNIAFAWPAESAGRVFSKCVSMLTSKPSLTIWKSLIYALQDVVESLKTNEWDENLLFLLEFVSALLCQYLCGCRLSEHAEQFWTEIENNQLFIHKVLGEFGRTLLNFEHNTRTMNTFLTVCYYTANFNLMFFYYCPDSISSKLDLPKLIGDVYNYLTQDEWTLIEQRIVNFGKTECKVNINRLHIQNAKSKQLIETNTEKNTNIKKFLLSSTFTDIEQISAIFADSTNFWLIELLSREQITRICELLLTDIEIVNQLLLQESIYEKKEFLEIMVILIYKKIANCFDSKKSITKTIDFDGALNKSNENEAHDIITKLNENRSSYSIKKYDSETIELLLNSLREIPLASSLRTIRGLIFAINLAVYEDLIAAKDEKLQSLCFRIFKNLLHLIPNTEIFQHLNISKILEILSPTKYNLFYEMIFEKLQITSKPAEQILETVVTLLQCSQPELSDDLVTLAVVFIETLPRNGAFQKRKIYYDNVLEVLDLHIKTYFANENRNVAEDKNFIQMVLPAYPAIINLTVKKNIENGTDSLDEYCRRICKIFIALTIDCNNKHAVNLINIALTSRKQLHLEDDEIELILEKYWEQLKDDIKHDRTTLASADTILMLIMEHKSKDDFKKLFIKILQEIQFEDFTYVCRLLLYVSKCQLSSTKVAIFNECFRAILFKVIINLKKKENNLFIDTEIVFNILDVQRTICENKQIPISPNLVDDILCFIMEINLKKIKVDKNNYKLVCKLLDRASSICVALIRFRYSIIKARMPQFMYIFGDMMQTVCWYKSDRDKDEPLSNEEIDELAELSNKLENLMYIISKNSLDVKRIAPFMLIFIINLMVTNTRTTTLYPKIKTHFENICCDIISICDIKSQNFILRNSNEAAKQVYQKLNNEYQKYRKFKGKS